MKALRVTFLTFLIATLIAESFQKEYLNSDLDICRLFKDGVKLRKPGTCNVGIQCQNFKSVEITTCSGTTPYYKRSGSCAKSDSDSYCKTACVKKSSGYVTDKKNCQGWYRCNGATELGKGDCESNLHFDQSAQMCIYPEKSSCNPTYEFCDVVPTGTQFRDENNCHKFYECTTLKGLQSKQCAVGTYFDVSTAKCIAKAQVDCYKHPYPDDVCGDAKLAIRNRFVIDGATCRGYFYCNDLGVGNPDKTPTWGQCSTTSFFDYREQACLPRTHVKCAEDRCDGRTSGKEISETKGCAHYLVCSNGITQGEEDCGPGLWFDAENEICTSVPKSYPACA